MSGIGKTRLTPSLTGLKSPHAIIATCIPPIAKTDERKKK